MNPKLDSESKLKSAMPTLAQMCTQTHEPCVGSLVESWKENIRQYLRDGLDYDQLRAHVAKLFNQNLSCFEPVRDAFREAIFRSAEQQLTELHNGDLSSRALDRITILLDACDPSKRSFFKDPEECARWSRLAYRSLHQAHAKPEWLETDYERVDLSLRILCSCFEQGNEQRGLMSGLIADELVAGLRKFNSHVPSGFASMRGGEILTRYVDLSAYLVCDELRAALVELCSELHSYCGQNFDGFRDLAGEWGGDFESTEEFDSAVDTFFEESSAEPVPVEYECDSKPNPEYILNSRFNLDDEMQCEAVKSILLELSQKIPEVLAGFPPGSIDEVEFWHDLLMSHSEAPGWFESMRVLAKIDVTEALRHLSTALFLASRSEREGIAFLKLCMNSTLLSEVESELRTEPNARIAVVCDRIDKGLSECYLEPNYELWQVEDVFERLRALV